MALRNKEQRELLFAESRRRQEKEQKDLKHIKSILSKEKKKERIRIRKIREKFEIQWKREKIIKLD